VDLKEIGWEGVNWIHVAQNRDQWQFVNSVKNLQVPKRKGNFLTRWANIGFPRTLL